MSGELVHDVIEYGVIVLAVATVGLWVGVAYVDGLTLEHLSMFAIAGSLAVMTWYARQWRKLAMKPQNRWSP